MKVLAGMIIFLLSLSGLLGFYHWSSYQHESNPENTSHPNERITITDEHDYLSVEHTINELQAGEYSIDVPTQIPINSCQINRETTCLEDANTILIEDPSQVSLKYEIPIEQPDDPYLHIADSFAEWLSDDEPVSTSLRVSIVGQKDKGSWSSVKDPVFTSEKEATEFYQWHLEPSEPVVFVRLDEDFQYQAHINGIQVVSSIPVDTTIIEESVDQFNQDLHHILIIDPNGAKMERDSFSVVSSSEKRSILSSFLMSNLITETDFHQEEHWILRVLSDLIYQTNRSENEHELAVVDELISQTSSNQIEQLHQQLSDVNSPSDPLKEVVDELLSEVMRFQTTFFQLNSETDDLVRLYGVDDRDIMINDERQEVEWESVIYNNRHYFPFAESLESLGIERYFSVKGGSEWFFEHQSRSIRLYIDRDVYHINDERYMAEEFDWVEINGQLFIDSDLLSDLLQIELEQDAESIYLNGV
ncbi:hypothetical protein [Alkalibacillus aidingensis]|uniref:hypothetical protein n=1 Tax=Alkalibacillus aidingensis TaxID=2747607 RepID=UPI001660DFBD|nr:hypothetical protein [Alkalibacillus aidingensis]